MTGDRIVVAGERISVGRGPGRAGVGFLTHRIRGHQYVIPTDALPLLGAGRLDRRLFDITTMLGFGYGGRADLPLIVTYSGSKAAATIQGATVTRALPAVNGVAVRASTKDTAAFWKGITGGGGGGPARVWLDGLRQPTLDVSVPLIGAPAAWAAGFDGTGTTVAVLDTGVDNTHPDLADRIVARMNFTDGAEDDRDLVGHGTHVASTVAGSGAASSGRYKGVAPGAKLLDGKVCAQFGCAESWLLAGMQWAAEQGADVVNMSLGGPDTPDVDPVEEAVNTLTAQFGTLFVIAAGNDGADGSVSSPSTADAALSVGAVTKTEELADFSSRGPRVGDSGLKPEITGPGVDITAARGRDGFLGTPGEPYMTISGTSMATPHVAGAAAILAQRRPDHTPAQLKATLMGAAKPNPTLGAFTQGAGRVDVARAVNQQVTADPPGVSFGLQVWPHNDDPPVTKTVTYRNSGSAAVTLTLAVQPAGTAPPAGMFTVSASTLTVPAGGTAAVTVTADTRAGTADGFFGGRLVATAGDTVVQTPFAVDREVESYDLTLVHTDREGQLTDSYSTLLIRVDQFAVFFPYDPDGTLTVRVPKGVYLLASNVFKFPEEGPIQLTTMAQPRLEVTGPQTINLDARLGRPVRVTVPQADATMVGAEIEMNLDTPEVGIGIGIFIGSFEDVSTAQIGPDRAVEGFRSKIGGTWARISDEGTVEDSPFVYSAAYFAEGRMFTGLQRAIAQRDLATVRARHAAQSTGTIGIKWIGSVAPGALYASSALGLPIRLPGTRTEYYAGDPGTRWMPSFDEVIVDEQGFPSEFVGGATSPPVTYRAGHAIAEDWNRSVFGPGFGRPIFGEDFVSRAGDLMFVFPALFADSVGRPGYGAFADARVALFKDGTKIAEGPEPGGVFEVPADNGRYRLELQVRRTPTATVSTQVSGVWTFRSGHVDSKVARRLPLFTVGFAPAVDDRQTARSGRLTLVPVTVVSQPGSPVGQVRKLAVDVSYDDGRTWHRAPVLRTPGGRQVLLNHPRGTGFVSLRASVTDDRGNTMEQTIIRAYRIAP